MEKVRDSDREKKKKQINMEILLIYNIKGILRDQQKYGGL